ncbi:MAG: flagellar basal body P-ring protein FlgI [Acidobacteriia bacterium]|nr:flagellar basal body P-ring protein FlgI [Terriglobia bacterium]
MRVRQNVLSGALLVLAALTPGVCAEDAKIHTARLKDVTTVEGVRDNMLMGYGLVAGLNGTGDRQQTIFSTQTLASMLQKMGVTVAAPATMLVHNIAAVFVTATLPPFSQPGMRIDATISSIGDAKSLEGGTLLLTSLFGPDGQVYAVAQGGLVLGGYSAGGRGNAKLLNHPTVGRIAGGALVERDTAVNLRDFTSVSLLLRNPDYATARDVAAVVNKELGKSVAQAIDSRRVEITGIDKGPDAVLRLLARIEELNVQFSTPAKVIVNERTGTVVMGADVSLGPCSILHGNLAIEVTTRLEVSQPQPLGQGQTAVVPETTVKAQEGPAQAIHLEEGATVDQLIQGLQSIGATARDIVAILQAIKASGALQAELEIL